MPKRGSPDSGVPRHPENRAHAVARGPRDRRSYSPPRGRRVRPVLRPLHRQGPRRRPAADPPGPGTGHASVARRPVRGQGIAPLRPGKWSIKEVIGHVTDAERVFSYRALRFARADTISLPGFDENAWVPAGNFGARSLADLAAELDAVRPATIALFRGLDAAALARRGTASDNAVSVRAIAWIIAGHERHHVALLHERYGV